MDEQGVTKVGAVGVMRATALWTTGLTLGVAVGLAIGVNAPEEGLAGLKRSFRIKAERTIEPGIPITMHTTGYHCPRGSQYRQCDSDGQNDGLTATMIPVKKGVCAADWKVFPPGTQFIVPDYGPCTVQDNGRKIKGRDLDLYFESNEEAVKHGQKETMVYLVRWGPE